jgi:large subunit ribosomal protein L10
MRPEKVSVLAEVKDRIGKSEFTMLVDYLGLSVEQISELRSRLRGVNSSLMVVRNAVAKKAVVDLGWGVAGDPFNGPSSVVFGSGDPSAVVKTLRAMRSDRIPLPVKCGWLNGASLSAADAEALADIPSREVLLGRLVGTVAAPMSGLVGALKQKLASVVYVLKAIEEKKG